MLESIPITQFNEWMAFFRLREELRENDGKLLPRHNPDGDSVKALSVNLLHNMQAYQGMRDRAFGRHKK